jgi:hypothetical protein
VRAGRVVRQQRPVGRIDDDLAVEPEMSFSTPLADTSRTVQYDFPKSLSLIVRAMACLPFG